VLSFATADLALALSASQLAALGSTPTAEAAIQELFG